MSMRSRLVLIIVTCIFVWGCENSNQTSSQPQAVRRKIVDEPSKAVDAQKKSTKPTATGTPAKAQLSEKDPATELLAINGSADEYQYQGIIDPFFPLIRDEKKAPPPEVKKEKTGPPVAAREDRFNPVNVDCYFQGENT